MRKPRAPRPGGGAAPRWDRTELQRLFMLCNKYKKGHYGHPDWSRIVHHFPGRTQNALRAQLSAHRKQDPHVNAAATDPARKAKRKAVSPAMSSDDEPVVRKKVSAAASGQLSTFCQATSVVRHASRLMRFQRDAGQKRPEITAAQTATVSKALAQVLDLIESDDDE